MFDIAKATSVVVDTPECNASTGKVFIARDPIAQNFICRINKVNDAFCAIVKSTRTQAVKLNSYCPIESEPSVPVAPVVVADQCILDCIPTEAPAVYEINVNDLDQDMNDLLALLESEVCETLALAKLLSETNTPCE